METLLVFLLEMVLILVVTRAGAYVATKLGVAPVLGELVAGLVLGPTVLGLLWPQAEAYLFPPMGTINGAILEAFAWMGLVFLMFVGGLEIEMSEVRANLGRAVCIAVGAVGLAFAAGFTLAGHLPADLFPTPNRLRVPVVFRQRAGHYGRPHPYQDSAGPGVVLHPLRENRGGSGGYRRHDGLVHPGSSYPGDRGGLLGGRDA